MRSFGGEILSGRRKAAAESLVSPLEAGELACWIGAKKHKGVPRDGC